MALKICDNSPCDPLFQTLGRWIFGDQTEGGFYMTVLPRASQGLDDDMEWDGDPSEIDIAYCPFCGTRLDGVGGLVLDSFTRRKRKRRKKQVAQVKGAKAVSSKKVKHR